MHGCASLSSYSCDMLMKCMLMPKEVFFFIFFNNGMMIKIVMDLLLYTSEGEGKGQKYSPFCVLI